MRTTAATTGYILFTLQQQPEPGTYVRTRLLVLPLHGKKPSFPQKTSMTTAVDVKPTTGITGRFLFFLRRSFYIFFLTSTRSTSTAPTPPLLRAGCRFLPLAGVFVFSIFAARCKVQLAEAEDGPAVAGATDRALPFVTRFTESREPPQHCSSI